MHWRTPRERPRSIRRCGRIRERRVRVVAGMESQGLGMRGVVVGGEVDIELGVRRNGRRVDLGGGGWREENEVVGRRGGWRRGTRTNCIGC